MPTVCTAAMTKTAISEAMSTYSIAVTSDQRRRDCFVVSDIPDSASSAIVREPLSGRADDNVPSLLSEPLTPVGGRVFAVTRLERESL
jgi:hypothetical protein